VPSDPTRSVPLLGTDVGWNSIGCIFVDGGGGGGRLLILVMDNMTLSSWSLRLDYFARLDAARANRMRAEVDLYGNDMYLKQVGEAHVDTPHFSFAVFAWPPRAAGLEVRVLKRRMLISHYSNANSNRR